MRRLLLSVILIISLVGCGGGAPEGSPNTEGGDRVSSDGFFTDATTLYDAGGNAFVMRGVNHSHTWFKDKLDTALGAIAATGANTVRIVLSNGERWNKDEAADVRRVTEKCAELEMIAVLEVHDATGSNDAEDLMKAVDYWIEIKDVLIGNEAYVIVNVANEWYGDRNGEDWRDGYIEAITRLRGAGIKNTIIVDAAGWGQYPKSIHDFGREVFDSDKLRNTVFSIHMYEYAGKNEKTVKVNIDRALDIGVPVIIGEFGQRHTNGKVAFETILSYCEEKGVGYLGWSWKGNSGGVEYLDIALQWDGSALSEDWGEILVNSEYGLKATGKKCTVFE
ncbi:MAG: glycoside hydrolase family 5 protein [Oscillospiraceae bacterium]|jgi:mannan endo-1,4-beta-mannosidase|nr:glycoside hydrolase family 5 protein [Oscillospiraceae bacterium]